MIELSIKTLAQVLNVNLGSLPDISFRGVTIDSRKACDGCLFIALKGQHFDGHRFVDAAYQNGAVVALVEQVQSDSRIPQIHVDDCQQAMSALASNWRQDCDPLVLALTGSNGKTTVKEMLTRILISEAPTHATSGNFNNEIGVPLTLFELEPKHRFAIIEIGANHQGEIALLAQIAKPDLVYVNNVAAAHLAGFGDIDGVAAAKGELYDYCEPHHKALFNLDESASEGWQQACLAKIRLSCGTSDNADVWVSWQAQNFSMKLEFRYQGLTQSCALSVMGEHNARNAVAAVAMAVLAGVDFASAVKHLDGFSGVKGRLQILPGPMQSHLIDDSYNANPDSLEAGIRVLCDLPGSAWVALGDMGELGRGGAEYHREAARMAQKLGVERLFGLGELSCLAAKEFGEAGLGFERIEDMCDCIKSQIHQGVNLMIKGSRAAGMERLVEMLTSSLNPGGANAV